MRRNERKCLTLKKDELLKLARKNKINVKDSSKRDGLKVKQDLCSELAKKIDFYNLNSPTRSRRKSPTPPRRKSPTRTSTMRDPRRVSSVDLDSYRYILQRYFELESETSVQLKRLAAVENINRYSIMKKNQLIIALLNIYYPSSDDAIDRLKDLVEMSVRDIRTYGKENNIKGVSKLTRKQLLEKLFITDEPIRFISPSTTPLIGSPARMRAQILASQDRLSPVRSRMPSPVRVRAPAMDKDVRADCELNRKEDLLGIAAFYNINPKLSNGKAKTKKQLCDEILLLEDSTEIKDSDLSDNEYTSRSPTPISPTRSFISDSIYGDVKNQILDSYVSYEEKTVKQLKSIAKNKNITSYNSLNKNPLIESLLISDFPDHVQHVQALISLMKKSKKSLLKNANELNINTNNLDKLELVRVLFQDLPTRSRTSSPSLSPVRFRSLSPVRYRPLSRIRSEGSISPSFSPVSYRSRTPSTSSTSSRSSVRYVTRTPSSRRSSIDSVGSSIESSIRSSRQNLLDGDDIEDNSPILSPLVVKKKPKISSDELNRNLYPRVIEKKSIFDLSGDETPSPATSIQKKINDISRVNEQLAENISEKIIENQTNISQNIVDVEREFPDTDPSLIENVVTDRIVNNVINESVNEFVSEGRINPLQAEELLINLQDENIIPDGVSFQSSTVEPEIKLKPIPPERLRKVEDVLKEIQKPTQNMTNLVSIRQKVFRSLGLIN